MNATTSTPTARVDEDGALWWTHLCTWQGKTRELTTRLPQGPAWWEVTQLEPLTLSDSINCGLCGTHGFITNGEWIRAGG